MGDLTMRLPKFLRRSSTVSTSAAATNNPLLLRKRNRSRASLSLQPKSRGREVEQPVSEGGGLQDSPIPERSQPPLLDSSTRTPTLRTESNITEDLQPTPNASLETPLSIAKVTPLVTVQEPTPDLIGSDGPQLGGDRQSAEDNDGDRAGRLAPEPSHKPEIIHRPNLAPRSQSLVPISQTQLINSLLQPDKPPPSRSGNIDYFTDPPTIDIGSNMIHRKIWVKRPGASATLVLINEDDLVDDVRDMILKKYANSLGRNFDSPDITLRITARDHSRRQSNGERTLGPEEPITRTLDAYFPGGQTVEEALIIDIPQRRTPRPSPRAGHQIPYYLTEDIRPGESGTDYFPPMPAAPSPHLPSGSVSLTSGQVGAHHASLHSISVLNTGQLPPLPSPGSRGTRHSHRPKYGRQHTSSPTILTSVSSTANNGMPPHSNPYASRVGVDSDTSDALKPMNGAPVPPPLPTPPASLEQPPRRVSTPPPQRVASPRPQAKSSNIKRLKKNADHLSLPAGLLDGAVPPINVLIVEDNIINLKLLEAFMKRLKVRWQTAMNGREAVTKWRAGGFHLVLMDIQLPVMNGLEATKEIRRLERLNSIGVFSSSASSIAQSAAAGDEPDGDDKLPNTILFKSPVIIVALTASSLQSDRHEALAAGCNDFLTKVNAPLLIYHSVFPLKNSTNAPLARQLRMARAQSDGMGLYASAHRLRWLAQVERFLPKR